MAFTNIEVRDAILARIEATPARHRFSSDWTRAKYLAKGEMIVGIVGGRANSIIFSPAFSRDACDHDRVLFYGATGVLAHEEPAHASANKSAISTLLSLVSA